MKKLLPGLIWSFQSRPKRHPP